MRKVLVIGSANVDLSFYSPFPKEGETIGGTSFKTSVGGKGANQSAAASLSGAKTTFICSLGNDEEGLRVRKELLDKGVESVVHESKNRTGAAFINVDPLGRNKIVVVKGANGDLTPSFLEANEQYFRDTDCVLMQLEIPVETAKKAAELGKKYGKTVILNPAPVKLLDREILSMIDYITPNEHEIKAIISSLSDKEFLGDEEEAAFLLSLGVGNVIVTQGSEGSLLVNKDLVWHCPSRKVKAVDTVAAGDCFSGVFARYLDLGIQEAMLRASVASSITVSRFGALPSLPNEEEILEAFSSWEK